MMRTGGHRSIAIRSALLGAVISISCQCITKSQQPGEAEPKGLVTSIRSGEVTDLRAYFGLNRESQANNIPIKLLSSVSSRSANDFLSSIDRKTLETLALENAWLGLECDDGTDATKLKDALITLASSSDSQVFSRLLALKSLTSSNESGEVYDAACGIIISSLLANRWRIDNESGSQIDVMACLSSCRCMIEQSKLQDMIADRTVDASSVDQVLSCCDTICSLDYIVPFDLTREVAFFNALVPSVENGLGQKYSGESEIRWFLSKGLRIGSYSTALREKRLVFFTEMISRMQAFLSYAIESRISEEKLRRLARCFLVVVYRACQSDSLREVNAYSLQLLQLKRILKDAGVEFAESESTRRFEEMVEQARLDWRDCYSLRGPEAGQDLAFEQRVIDNLLLINRLARVCEKDLVRRSGE